MTRAWLPTHELAHDGAWIKVHYTDFGGSPHRGQEIEALDGTKFPLNENTLIRPIRRIKRYKP